MAFVLSTYELMASVTLDPLVTPAAYLLPSNALVVLVGLLVVKTRKEDCSSWGRTIGFGVGMVFLTLLF